jgi:uncharacterized protein (TIGR00369 family)
VENRDGLDIIRSWLNGAEQATFENLLGIELVDAKPGNIVMSAVPDKPHYNGMGRVHGGYCASLIDTAMGSAAISSLSPYRAVGTVGLNIHYVRKIDIESGKLLCRANVVHGGLTMLTCEAKVHDAHGKLCAHATGTFLVYPF